MKYIICAVNFNDEYISRMESKGGRSTLESWIRTAQTLEKLQLDHVFELEWGRLESEELEFNTKRPHMRYSN